MRCRDARKSERGRRRETPRRGGDRAQGNSRSPRQGRPAGALGKGSLRRRHPLGEESGIHHRWRVWEGRAQLPDGQRVERSLVTGTAKRQRRVPDRRRDGRPRSAVHE